MYVKSNMKKNVFLHILSFFIGIQGLKCGDHI